MRNARNGLLPEPYDERPLIVGAGAIGAQLEQRMLDNPSLGIIPVGYIDADPPSDIRRTAPVLGSPDMLETIVRDPRIDYVVARRIFLVVS